ncbi:hypothetical protein FHR81_002538 [Actinoalloteichus hoggarensis]|uniref:Uncharacterized protein n=1 Tax=Actinoalloteichus hoggarensis TaxID=1470176 RepID=A0A221VX71_9PSEU|nr:hypothetical protein [Actinoalloteichus hoggarensis]ASO18142.1 hypothetical protein AHOG_02390 [Actinoalloteichus hoggarensis]MBB5921498.1 hypothetical protein [Actinoalloteichus hoggarensis]
MDQQARLAQFAAARSELDRIEAVADARMAEIKQQQLPESGLSEAEIAQIEQFARSKDAPAELRALQERIDKGDLSWRDIADGSAVQDEQVQRALASGVPKLQQAYTMIQEGHSIDDILDAGDPFAGPNAAGPGPVASGGPLPDTSSGTGSDGRQAPPRRDDDDEEGGSVFRRGGW